MKNNKWEHKGKQVNQLVNSLCQKVKIPFISTENVTKGILNKSDLHLKC